MGKQKRPRRGCDYRHGEVYEQYIITCQKSLTNIHHAERPKENYKKVLITEYKANAVGLDIIKLMAYND